MLRICIDRNTHEEGAERFFYLKAERWNGFFVYEDVRGTNAQGIISGDIAETIRNARTHWFEAIGSVLYGSFMEWWESISIITKDFETPSIRMFIRNYNNMPVNCDLENHQNNCAIVKFINAVHEWLG